MSYIRLLFEYGIYHVYNRGNNKERIFPTDQDKDVFLKQIMRLQKEYGFIVYAYCIMDNHYHLVFKDVGEKLPMIMGLIQQNYAIYYNAKYKRSGQVFENPFKSNPVLNLHHFFILLCYVANNPVAAYITTEYHRYNWSSKYIKGYDEYNIVDYEYANYLCKKHNRMSVHEYLLLQKSKGLISILEMQRHEDNNAINIFNQIIIAVIGKQEFNKDKISTDIMIEIIKEAYYQGLSVRQIVDLTGMSYRFVKNHKRPDKLYI